jgi:acetyltransferase-like isoleucine patch superfamily enzyme
MIPSFLLFLLPTKVVRFVLPNSRWNIQPGASIGFSWVKVKYLSMKAGSRIGHLNFIECDRVVLKDHAVIHSTNIIRGPFSIWMGHKAQIGNRNVVSRPPRGVSWGRSSLGIGVNSKITAGHKVDCTRSVKIGANSIIAGLASQLWTHGYIHDSAGGRFRVDGAIDIGKNVYIGSACVINAGVYMVDNVIVGSHSCISKDLVKPGLYVSSPIRYINHNLEEVMTRLSSVHGFDLCESVYVKNTNYSTIENQRISQNNGELEQDDKF